MFLVWAFTNNLQYILGCTTNVDKTPKNKMECFALFYCRLCAKQKCMNINKNKNEKKNIGITIASNV